MNKISKLLMALMMTGMLVSVDAGAQVVRGNVTTTSATAPTAGSVAQGVAVRNSSNAGAPGTAVQNSGSTGGQMAVAGSATLGATIYTKCPAGTYEKKFTGKNERGGQCLPCTGNTYSSERGSKKCKTCPPGKEPNKDHTACVNKCPANAVCKDGTNFVCKPGYYKASSTAKTCTKCSAGYACNDQVGSKREKCPAGFYAPTGSVYCEPCPSGTYSSAGAAKCTSCPKNATCPNQRDTFVTCKDGYYQTSAKTKACAKCPAGYECFGNKRKKCPAGSYAPAGNKNPCEFCLGNTYSSAGAAKCKSCPKGQKANENHTACVKA